MFTENFKLKKSDTQKTKQILKNIPDHVMNLKM